MTETQLAAWARINASGLVKKLRLLIAAEVAESPHPPTASEMVPGVTARRGGIITRRDTISPRCKELKKMNVIRVAGTRPCQVTEVECETYELTGLDPIPYVKPPQLEHLWHVEASIAQNAQWFDTLEEARAYAAVEDLEIKHFKECRKLEKHVRRVRRHHV